MLIIRDVNTLLRPVEICRQADKGWNKWDQLSICKNVLRTQKTNIALLSILQPDSVLPRLLCVALLALRHGVDGQAEDRLELGAGGGGQAPVMTDRTLLQVRHNILTSQPRGKYKFNLIPNLLPKTLLSPVYKYNKSWQNCLLYWAISKFASQSMGIYWIYFRNSCWEKPWTRSTPLHHRRRPQSTR